jgi:hypothetical protein
MLFSPKESTEDSLTRLLIAGQKSVKELQILLEHDKKAVTFQGIYKALTALLKSELVIKKGSLYFINEEWRQKVISNLDSGNSFVLGDKEKINYELSSLIHLDQYWKNLILPLHKAHPEDPIFIYNPHEIWLHLSEQRKQSELDYYESFSKNKIFAFYALGGNTIHDQSIKKQFQNDYLQINVGNEYFPKTDYPVVFNDYILTTRISKSNSEKIEKCYAESETAEELELRLQKIGIEKNKTKLIVLKDREKAKRLRKTLSKKFFIPPSLVKKFDLF